MFGVGGNFVYGPILIHIGIHPSVSSSSCLYMICFSSGVSFFMFAIYGQVNFPFALACALFTATGVFAGLFLVTRLIKKYKRPSIIVFALATAIGIASIVSIISSSASLHDKMSNDVDVMSGEPIC